MSSADTRDMLVQASSSQCNAMKQQLLSPHHMGGGSHMPKVLYGHRGLNSDTREAITRPPTRGTVLPCGTCALGAELCSCLLCR
jgi:hypothetical protein